jgi:glutamine synthetase
MHWHVSVQQPGQSWPHHFAFADGRDSPALAYFAGGLQRGAAAAMALFSPHDMGFDRIAMSNASPTEASWGAESRALAFRVPESGPSARRLENRLPGGDANPYLTLAAMLGLGLDGLLGEKPPLPADAPSLRLPRSLPEALDALQNSAELADCLGRPLLDLYVALKRHEHAERAALSEPRADWDLTHLLELA